MSRRHFVLPALVGFALAAGIACQDAAPPGAGPAPPCDELRWTGPPERRNVVVVLTDTTRRDRMSAYGGPAETPAFDRFASDHVLFTRAESQAPWTKPAIATLFTGLHPSQHGVITHPDRKFGRARAELEETDALAPGFETLAETLQSAGYRTGAFVSNPWLQASLGFGQGFETYDDSFAGDATPGSVVTAAGLDWVAQGDDASPYFLYLHFMDAHGPYPPLERSRVAEHRETIRDDDRVIPTKARLSIRENVRYVDGERVAEPGLPPNAALLELQYDGGVSQFDRAFDALLEGLASRSDWDRTALIVTSDHGEALFERGWTGHGYGLVQEETAVPLAARLPGVEAESPVACPTGLVDVMPTLCTYLDLPCPTIAAGRSWLPPHQGEDTRPAGYLVSEGVIRRPRNRSISSERYKLIHRPDGRVDQREPAESWSLYDLEVDAANRDDLLTRETPEIRAVFEAMKQGVESAVGPVDVPEAPRVPVDDETRRRLEELGYLE